MARFGSANWLKRLDPRYLVMLYLAVLLLIPVNVYKIPSGLPIDMRPERIVAFGIFLLWVATLLVDRKTTLGKSPINIAMVIFFFVMLFSFVFNMQNLVADGQYSSAIKSLFTFSVYFLLFAFASSVVKTLPQIDAILKFGIGIIIVVSLLMGVEFITGFNIFRHLHEFFSFLKPNIDSLGNSYKRGGYFRAFGSADHPIAASVILLMFLPIAFHYFEFARSTKEKVFYGWATALIGFASLTTISRSAIVALFAIFFVYASLKRDQFLKLGAAVIIVFAVVFIAFPGLLGGLETRFTPSYWVQHEISDPDGRVMDYPMVWNYFLQKPYLGWGYGWWDNHKVAYLDNQYLGTLVQLGAAGFAAMLWMFWRLVKTLQIAAKGATKKEKDLLVAILAAFVAFIVTSATYDSLGFPQVSYLFFVFAGLGASLARHVMAETVPSQEHFGGGEDVGSAGYLGFNS